MQTLHSAPEPPSDDSRPHLRPSSRSPAPAPRCAVGLVTWNGGGDLVACMRALAAQDDPLEIAWIDNASTDGSVQAARQSFDATTRPPDASPAPMANANPLPAPRVLERNTGFCGGHNLAFAATQARYYLALNQDAFLASDYVRRLCDWMDDDPSLAMASGLLLETESSADSPDRERARVYSAGLAMTRARFPYELGMGCPASRIPRGRRIVPAVTGAAMMIRRSAIMGATAGANEDIGCAPLPGGDPLFPSTFFAYFEEVDLALRLTEAGFRCGVDADALAWHAARGQGGRGRPAIRAHYFANHWLSVLRHAGPAELLHDLPWLVKGKLRHYLPQYAREPLAAARSLGPLFAGAPDAIRIRRAMARLHPEARARRNRFFEESRGLLRKEALDA